MSGTRNIDVTATSKTIALPSLGLDLYINNTGTSNVAYIRFGAESPLTASGADFPIRAASSQLLRRNITDLYLAAVCDTGATTTLKVSSGNGIK